MMPYAVILTRTGNIAAVSISEMEEGEWILYECRTQVEAVNMEKALLAARGGGEPPQSQEEERI